MLAIKSLYYKKLRTIDKINDLPLTLISLVALICIIGIVMMYSAGQGNLQPYASKQLLHFVLFLPLMIGISLVDIRTIFRFSYVTYIVAIILLLAVIVMGHKAMGATRWIDLGFFKLQPSELAKIALILALARYFHNAPELEIKDLKRLITPGIFVGLSFILIAKQPDLGSALILFMMAVIMFFSAGVSIWVFVSFGIICFAAIPVAWYFLHDYQKLRVISFMNPEQDPLGAGYNIIQSKIAIGAGGFFGKGLLRGSQSQLEFLPEHQTDFIFTMISEELGFLGGMFILGLYSAIIIISIFIANNCRSHFARLVCIGFTSMIFLHIFVNIAMISGMIPAVGKPLPLLSYGGTNMLTSLIGFGLVINCYLNRNIYISRYGKSLI